MTNPTPQEIRAAYASLNELLKAAEGTPGIFAMRKAIERVMPQPTMADVEWDDDLHYLAEAELAGRTKVIMLRKTAEERITFIEDGITATVCPKSLTPTGRRYILTEMEE